MSHKTITASLGKDKVRLTISTQEHIAEDQTIGDNAQLLAVAWNTFSELFLTHPTKITIDEEIQNG